MWDLAYPGGDAGEETMLTLQVRQLLSISIQKHRDKLLQDKAKHDASSAQAAASVDTVVGAYKAKRRKTEDPAKPAASSAMQF